MAEIIYVNVQKDWIIVLNLGKFDGEDLDIDAKNVKVSLFNNH